MRLFRDLTAVPALGCVATIGNFDGVHRGHQQLLQVLCQQAQQCALPSTVISFEPHPAVFLQKRPQLPRVTSFRTKLELLRQQGVQQCLCLRFNQSLASMSAEQFAQQILFNTLQVKALIIGRDFRFGAKRRGDLALLQQLAEPRGIALIPFEDCCENSQRISSTLVRQAISDGDFGQAADYLGRPYALSGKVIHGDKRGRLLGVPTANIPLAADQCLTTGIFVVKVTGIGDTPYYGVANLGRRPMYEVERPLLEVHLFDFSQSIYGKRLNVVLLKKLRDEQHFASEQALQQQMAFDIQQAKASLAEAAVATLTNQ